MGTNSSRDPIFTPELAKILKIFGIASIVLVVVLSFFNEKRANNTGEDRTFKVNSSNRLFFLNLRAIHYDREARTDAKMTLYRHKDQNTNLSNLGLVLILNSLKDEAYIYFEPIKTDWPIEIKVESSSGMKAFHFENGNNALLYSYFKELEPWFEEDADFSIRIKGEWKALWKVQEEREAIKEVMSDFNELLSDK